MDPNDVPMEEVEAEAEAEEEEEEGTQEPIVDLSGLNVEGSCEEILQFTHDDVNSFGRPRKLRVKRFESNAPSPTMPNKRKKRSTSRSTLY